MYTVSILIKIYLTLKLIYVVVVLCFGQNLSVKYNKGQLLLSYAKERYCTIRSIYQCSFKLIPPIVSVLCSGQNIRKLSETTGPTEAKFHVAPPWDR